MLDFEIPFMKKYLFEFDKVRFPCILSIEVNLELSKYYLPAEKEDL